MKKYHLRNVDCANCASKIEDALRNDSGGGTVRVNFIEQTVTLDTMTCDKANRIIRAVEPSAFIEESNSPKPQRVLFFSGKVFLLIALAAAFVTAMILQEVLHAGEKTLIIGIFLLVYFLSGYSVLYKAALNATRGKLFDEHFLMTIATIGALGMGAAEEAAAVMLLYSIGEYVQNYSLDKSRNSIKSLLALKADIAHKIENGIIKDIDPKDAVPGDSVLIKAGEKVPLDSVIIEGHASLDTSALTGEPMPHDVSPGDTILAGMVNISGIITVRVLKSYQDSSASRMMHLIEEASARKAKPEKFISSFARWYSPLVVFAALGIAFLPPLLFPQELFSVWIHRALVVLVISCPCALVISIPLSYFGGLGTASRNGILIKGSNYLDGLAHITNIVFDKTGTLTSGTFQIGNIKAAEGFTNQELLEIAAYAESHSNHPAAKAVVSGYGKPILQERIIAGNEFPGLGIEAVLDGKKVRIGNSRFVSVPEGIEHFGNENGMLHISLDEQYAGSIELIDVLKHRSKETIIELKKMGIEKISVLTGDNRRSAESILSGIPFDEIFADLKPEDKVAAFTKIKNTKPSTKADVTVFVGDGINDAPVLAAADIGIAMGGNGSDAAIENADIVLLNDNPHTIIHAIEIAKRTRKIVFQNIFFAVGIKGVFLFLGALGVAAMWEAVFADMGVAILAIVNSLRVKQ